MQFCVRILFTAIQLRMVLSQLNFKQASKESDWSMVCMERTWEGLKLCTTDHGVQSVMTFGLSVMPELLVGEFDVSAYSCISVVDFLCNLKGC